MTEQEWLAFRKRPDMMLAAARAKVSSRKQRLFACACARRFWHLLTEPIRGAVKVSEMVADGTATLDDLENARPPRGLQGGEPETWLAVVVASQATELEASRAAFCCATGPEFYKAARRQQKLGGPSWNAYRCDLLRDIFGNPFRPLTLNPSWLVWNNATIPKLAQAIYDERRFTDLPILADAFEEAGCTSQDILGHCRTPGEHVRGCWVVDLVLGKE